MTHNFSSTQDSGGRSTVNARDAHPQRESLGLLRREVEELRASRKRLLLTADDDRRRIEHDLHEGIQQHLVALTVNLQLADRLTGSDPPAAGELIAEMARDVQQALEETAQLAQRIYPPLLEARGLSAALRSAETDARPSPASRSRVWRALQRRSPPLSTSPYATCWRKFATTRG